MDAAIAELARRQHGIVAKHQCRAAGMSDEAVWHRLRARRWHTVHRGVYAVGHAPLTHHARYLAAVLAAGPGAVVSHRTAASLWGLQPHHGGPVHVLSAIKKRPRKGLTTHWTRHLPASDRATRQGVPVTSLARTAADLVATVPAEEAELAIRAAERIHGFDRVRLRRTPQHGTLTRGHLERLFLGVLDGAGLARPQMNVPWGPYELDALWPAQGIVVEIDDFATHLNRTAMTRDRRRDRELTIAGLRPVRVTHDDLTTGREALIAQLRALGAPPRG